MRKFIREEATNLEDFYENKRYMTKEYLRFIMINTYSEKIR